jgi:hypothetical protein
MRKVLLFTAHFINRTVALCRAAGDLLSAVDLGYRAMVQEARRGDTSDRVTLEQTAISMISFQIGLLLWVDLLAAHRCPGVARKSPAFIRRG